MSMFISNKGDDELTDTVFGYVVRANEMYQVGKGRLRMAEFICEFFDISRVDDIRNQLQGLEKGERSTSSCTTNISYRCLKCDDRRMICYSCAV